MQRMQKTELVVKNVCPECGTSSCVQFLSIDGTEVHITCVDCNRVYAARVPTATKSGDLEIVTRWREVGSFVRL